MVTVQNPSLLFDNFFDTKSTLLYRLASFCLVSSANCKRECVAVCTHFDWKYEHSISANYCGNIISGIIRLSTGEIGRVRQR